MIFTLLRLSTPSHIPNLVKPHLRTPNLTYHRDVGCCNDTLINPSLSVTADIL